MVYQGGQASLTMGALRRVVVAPLAGNRRRGLVVAGPLRAPCALGRTGTTRAKREGDGATPVGSFGLVGVYYRADRVPRPVTRLAAIPLRPDLGWCDDPADRSYNRPVRLPCPARHERLWRDDRLYDVVVVLDYNLARPRPGLGSAIFLHLAGPDFAPTAGCIAVAPAAMRRLLALVAPDTVVEVR
jgi:L,D-peptidoglycan transpeptidase YkuD (ErfK/YbiS/YcfS/YnhG family)